MTEHLIEAGASKAEVLKTDKGQLSDADFADMHKWQGAEDVDLLRGWIDGLKEHGVFFSEPLDLDLAMLAAFPAAYSKAIPKTGGPRTSVAKAAKVVLGTSGSKLTMYTGPYEDYPTHFPAYRYHFLTKSKPASHLAALTNISCSDLKSGMPSELAEVLAHIAQSLRHD